MVRVLGAEHGDKGVGAGFREFPGVYQVGVAPHGVNRRPDHQGLGAVDVDRERMRAAYDLFTNENVHDKTMAGSRHYSGCPAMYRDERSPG
jgi:hypothetical protein